MQRHGFRFSNFNHLYLMPICLMYIISTIAIVKAANYRKSCDIIEHLTQKRLYLKMRLHLSFYNSIDITLLPV